MTDYKTMTIDSFSEHWNKRQVERDLIPNSMLELAYQLTNRGYFLKLEKLNAQIPNVEIKKSAEFHSYKWENIESELKKELLENINIVDGKYQLTTITTQVDICSVDWYDHYRLIRLKDSGWENSELYLYYLLGPDIELFRLNGTSPPIHEVNSKAPIQLNEKNVISYLIFFCFFVRGEEGPFYVLESIDDPMLDKQREFLSSNKLIETTFEILEGNSQPVTLTGFNEVGHYLCKAVILYSNELFTANFAIHPTGMIEMLDDEPIAADMPLGINAPLS